MIGSEGLLKVSFLDVNQGDSAFIKTPENHYILIDGGPGSTVLEKLGKLIPFWNKTIDIVFLTHPEKDHLQGILDVLQRYRVNYFIWTGVVKDNAENKQLAFLLDKISSGNSPLTSFFSNSGTKVLTASMGKKIKAGSVLIEILYPFEDLAGEETKNTINDTCLVGKLVYEENSFLFTGDISSAVESQLVYSGQNLSADVLKVAHHGSKYSTSDLFLQNVRPEFAVIEVGKNSYGHPTPEVLQRLENFGIKIFITQRDGDAEFVSDGKNININ